MWPIEATLSFLSSAMLLTLYHYFTVDASTNEECRDLTFQELMMQREWILAERNIISHQLSLLDDIIKAKIEENQYVTSSTGVNSKKETCIEEESGSQKPSPRRYGSDPKQRQLEDTFLGREISFPSKKSIQESDDGDSSVLDAARKTAQLVESSTNFPPTMLAPLDAWYLTPFPQHDFSSNSVQEESIKGILLSAAAELNLSSETPNHASTDDAQATSSGHNRVGGQTVKSDRSPALPKCSNEDKGRDDVDDRKPHVDKRG